MDNGVQIQMPVMNIEKRNCKSYKAKEINVKIIEIDKNRSFLSIG